MAPLEEKLNELIKYTKANYYGLKLNTKLGSRQLWKNARGLGLVSSKKNSTRPNFTANDFNAHVTGICHSHHSTVTDVLRSTLSLTEIDLPLEMLEEVK